MKKHLFCILVSLTGFITCQGQRLPFFTHHVLNPYIYNPAFAGYNQSAVFYLTHRQQWLGIEGAPVSTHLSFHTPAGNNNPISLGANLVHDRVGILRHSTAKATLAYLVPLSVEKEHYVKFGISAGVGVHQYDLSETSVASDALIQRAATNSTFLDGRFGIHYRYEQLNIGVALPHLLTLPAQNPDGFSNVALDQFSRAIASVNYRFRLGVESKLAFVPTLLYNFSHESASQLEAIGLLEFQESFWIGGGYQQQQGFGGLVGFKMKNLTFSYHYGTGGNALAAYAIGTHEVQLGFTIGKKKVMVKRKPRLTTQTDTDEIPEALLKKERRRKKKAKEEIPDRKKLSSQREPKETFSDDSFEEVEQGIILIPSEGDKNTTAPSPATKQENGNQENDIREPKPDAKEDNAPVAPSAIPDNSPVVPTSTPENTVPDRQDTSSEAEDNVDPWQGIDDEQTATPPPAFGQSAEKAITKVQTVRSNHPLEMKGGIYIIAGTFSAQSNADRLAQQLARQGYSTTVGYNTTKGYYYVSLYESDDLEDVKKRLYLVRRKDTLKKAWILKIE